MVAVGRLTGGVVRCHAGLGEHLGLRNQKPGRQTRLSRGLGSHLIADTPKLTGLEQQRFSAQRAVSGDPAQEQDVVAGVDFGVWPAFDPGDGAAQPRRVVML